MPLSTHPQQYCGTVSLVLKQVPRGHNIIADGWAGASNSNPYLKSPTHMQKASKTLISPLYDFMDGPTNGSTNE